ncbi:STAS domain-containing protein [Actinotalea sp. AC32]|nr:STAS domain-containing protein [Actinotalea sp. AC32]
MIEALGREHDGAPSGMTLHEEPERSLVEVWGEVDLAVRQNAGPLCQAVTERALPVVIDAGRVSFVDSAGMSILVRIARDAEAGGYPVELRNAPWMLRELMTITGVDRLLPFGEDDAPTQQP